MNTEVENADGASGPRNGLHELKIRVEAQLIPPPEYMREGLKPERFEIDATINDLPEKLKQFAAFVLKTPCVQLGGSMVFLVQPLRTKADVRAAVNSALAGSA
jgi:hypothetical protein